MATREFFAVQVPDGGKATPLEGRLNAGDVFCATAVAMGPEFSYHNINTVRAALKVRPCGSDGEIVAA
jgi:hypothetical protein